LFLLLNGFLCREGGREGKMERGREKEGEKERPLNLPYISLVVFLF
jgi:hypothetical protein